MRTASILIAGVAIGLLAAAAWAYHAPGSSYFTDVSSLSPHNHDIGFCVEAGVTSGTGPDLYSPSLPVSRDQMASFLMRELAFTSALMPFWVDEVLFDGDITYDLYLQGYITYEEYEAILALIEWNLQLLDYQVSVMSSSSASEQVAAAGAGPGLEAAAAAVLRLMREKAKE
jgi:hypothetical protein